MFRMQLCSSAAAIPHRTAPDVQCLHPKLNSQPYEYKPVVSERSDVIIFLSIVVYERVSLQCECCAACKELQ